MLSYEHFEKSRGWYQDKELNKEFIEPIADPKERQEAGYKLANDYRKALLVEPMRLVDYIVRNERSFTEIVMADNKPAIINIGQRVPLITDSRVTERGDTITSFRYEDIGVNLTGTPKISPDGFVKLELGTTYSSIHSSEVKINPSATVQIINQRRANTTVSVQNGQTIIIGGLIGTQEDKRVRKVPYLGDIPYLGAAFRTTTVSRKKRELLIFLTPTIMANNQTSTPLTDSNESTRELLERSRLNQERKRNDFNRPLLDPIFPPTVTPPPTAMPSRKPAGV